MSDLVVTVPKDFWPDWIAEGDAVGEPKTGTEWSFYVGARKPSIRHGERLYIVACGRLRGYAPVTRVALARAGQWAICRQGGAVACTIDQEIRGFQGFRQPWWIRSDEMPFPGWQIVGVPIPMLDYFLPRLAANWDDQQALAVALAARHPFAEAILFIAAFLETARAVGARVRGIDLVGPLAKRLHLDEKTAERYIAHAIEPMRRWGFLGSGTQAA
jgi:hypothetical protein